MKNLFAAILVALTVVTSSTSFAANIAPDKEQSGKTTPAPVTFAQIEKSKLDVIVEYTVSPKTTILLADFSGKTIISKTLPAKQTGTRVRFDLASLQDGVYLVKVSNGRNTQVQKFELKTATPAITSYQDIAIL